MSTLSLTHGTTQDDNADSLTHGTTQDENADFSVVEYIIDSLTGYYLIILRVCGTVEPFRLSYQTHHY